MKSEANQDETLNFPPQHVEDVDHAERKCEMTENARRQLESWGITSSAIEELAELSARYEYNNIEAQAEGVVERGAFVSKTELGRPAIVLPNFYDLEGDRRTGQCAEISFKVLRDIVKGGWLDEVNAANIAAGHAPIGRQLIQGESPTHFSQHFWVNLYPEGSESTEVVIVDGSLNKILLQSEGGYTPTRVRNMKDTLSLLRHELLDIGRITSDEDGNWKTSGIASTLLSMTVDYTLGVDIGYGMDDENNLQLVLYAYDDSNTSIAGCTRVNGQRSWRDANNIIDDTRRVELEHIMDVLEGMPINYDESAYKRYQDDNIDNPQDTDLLSMDHPTR